VEFFREGNVKLLQTWVFRIRSKSLRWWWSWLKSEYLSNWRASKTKTCCVLLGNFFTHHRRQHEHQTEVCISVVLHVPKVSYPPPDKIELIRGIKRSLVRESEERRYGNGKILSSANVLWQLALGHLCKKFLNFARKLSTPPTKTTRIRLKQGNPCHNKILPIGQRPSTLTRQTSVEMVIKNWNQRQHISNK